MTTARHRHAARAAPAASAHHGATTTATTGSPSAPTTSTTSTLRVRGVGDERDRGRDGSGHQQTSDVLVHGRAPGKDHRLTVQQDGYQLMCPRVQTPRRVSIGDSTRSLPSRCPLWATPSRTRRSRGDTRPGQSLVKTRTCSDTPAMKNLTTAPASLSDPVPGSRPTTCGYHSPPDRIRAGDVHLPGAVSVGEKDT